MKEEWPHFEYNKHPKDNNRVEFHVPKFVKVLFGRSQITNIAAEIPANARVLTTFAPLVFPQFSVLDPITTYSLPTRQISNGIVDAFTHTSEQYLIYPTNASLQNRMAEAILKTLIEEGPKTSANLADYDARANVIGSSG